MSLLRRSALRALSVPLVIGLVATAFATPVSAATPPITFDLNIYDQCLDGRAPASSTVHLVWRDSSGALKASTDVLTSSAPTSGFWEYCATDPQIWVAPLDRIKATVGGYTRKFVVPNLTIRLDRVDDIALGSGPARRTIRVCSTWAIFGDYEQCHSVRVGDDGQWSYDPDSGLIAGVWASVNWTTPNDDHLHNYATAPQLKVTLGKSGFSGYADPRSEVQFEINSGAKGSGEAVGGRDGEFAGVFRDGGGHRVSVAPGDHITGSFASDEDWVVPAIEASGNRQNNVVTGTCHDTGLAAETVWLTVLRSGDIRGRGITNRESDGSFYIDFDDPGGFFSDTNLISGDNVLVGCSQTNGDIAQLKITIP